MSTVILHGGRALQVLAINERPGSYRRMTMTISTARADQELTGRALRAIRERAGKVQADVARAVGMTTQGWQKYEAGERRFKSDTLEAALNALDTTPEALEFERARLLGPNNPRANTDGVTDRSGRDFVFDVYGRGRAGPTGHEAYDVGEPIRRLDLRGLFGPRTDALEVFGDSMYPWAEPGEVVIFDRDRYPKRGAGCVVEMITGECFVKLYQRSDGSTLFVKELYPVDRELSYPLSKIAGVYAIRLRGD